MNQEIELVRALHLKQEMPVRGEPPDVAVASPETMAMRRALRTVTDNLRGAMDQGSALNTAKGIGETVIAATGPLVAMGLEPSFEEFLAGAAELIIDARKVLDDGLTAHDWEMVRKGSCMIGTVCMGLSAALGMPYAELVKELVLSKIEGRPDEIEELLTIVGVLEEKGESNAGQGG